MNYGLILVSKSSHGCVTSRLQSLILYFRAIDHLSDNMISVKTHIPGATYEFCTLTYNGQTRQTFAMNAYDERSVTV